MLPKIFEKKLSISFVYYFRLLIFAPINNSNPAEFLLKGTSNYGYKVS